MGKDIYLLHNEIEQKLEPPWPLNRLRNPRRRPHEQPVGQYRLRGPPAPHRVDGERRRTEYIALGQHWVSQY